MLALAIGVALIGWFAALRIERGTKARSEAAGEVQSATVLSEGVLFEARAGDPGLVIAKDVGSDKELCIYEGGLHDPYCDVDRERVLADLEDWLERHLQHPEL